MNKPSQNKPKEQNNFKKPDNQFKALIEAAKFKEKSLAAHALSTDRKVIENKSS